MKKILFTLTVVLLVLMGVPFCIEEFLSPSGKESWYFTTFLLVYPVFIALLGIFSGSDIKKLWFAPILASILFAPSFWLAWRSIDTSLLIYATIYLVIGLVTMAVSEILFDHSNKKNL